MKLIQLNAWGGRLEPQIGDLLADETPDILCLQEAISLGSAIGSGMFITTEAMQKRFGMSSSAFAPAFSFKYMDRVARFGNGILSKLPVKSTEVIFTHQDHQNDFVWNDDEIANMRNFIHAVLDVNGRDCHVLTHHGFWVREHKNGNDETTRQMNILADYVERLDGPIILTGDFNLAPTSPSLKRLDNTFVNLSSKFNLPTTRTELTHKTETCDYIFVNEAVQVNRFAALDKIVSDHKALALEFELK